MPKKSYVPGRGLSVGSWASRRASVGKFYIKKGTREDTEAGWVTDEGNSPST